MIDLHECGSEPCNRQHGDGMPPVVLQAEPDAVASPHSEPGEVPGGAPDELSQLAIAESPVMIDEGRRVGLRASLAKNRVDEVHGMLARLISCVPRASHRFAAPAAHRRRARRAIEDIPKVRRAISLTCLAIPRPIAEIGWRACRGESRAQKYTPCRWTPMRGKWLLSGWSSRSSLRRRKPPLIDGGR